MLSQITRARWIATVLSLKEVQNQLQPLYLTNLTNIKMNKLNKTPQNHTFEGWGSVFENVHE